MGSLGLRCEVCGRVIVGQPVTRKTCCVNKLYIFCSESCLANWTRHWLRRQEQVASMGPQSRRQTLGW